MLITNYTSIIYSILFKIQFYLASFTEKYSACILRFLRLKKPLSYGFKTHTNIKIYLKKSYLHTLGT